MREILFRGKDIFSGEWEYGGCVSTENEVFLIYNQTHSIDLEPHTVEKRTIGQYTGLTDKNGKKIFEGDIILIDFDGFPVYKREVSFNQDVSAYVLWNGIKSKFYPMTEAPKKYSEVIGNIHDNPELLEVAE